MNKREQQKQERRNTIIKVAKAMILEKGIQELQLQDVADAAGIGIATFYRYFPNKELLIIAVNNQIVEQMLADIEHRIKGAVNAYEEIERVLGYYVDIVEEPEQQFVRFVRSIEAYRPMEVESEEYQHYVSIRKRFSELLLAIATRGQQDGSIRSGVDLSFYLFTIVQNISHFASESKLTKHDPSLPLDLNSSQQVILLKDVFMAHLRANN